MKAEKGIVFALLLGILSGNAIGNVTASEGINVDYHSREEIKEYADTYVFMEKQLICGNLSGWHPIVLENYQMQPCRGHGKR